MVQWLTLQWVTFIIVLMLSIQIISCAKKWREKFNIVRYEANDKKNKYENSKSLIYMLQVSIDCT